MEKRNKCVVFDLDDTLYKEEDYVISAYRAIASLLEPVVNKNIFERMVLWRQEGKEPLDEIFQHYPQTRYKLADLLFCYRFHLPTITPEAYALEILSELRENGAVLGLLTDGRSVSQRNKLCALGLIDYFSTIVISEEFGSTKPSPANYLQFMLRHPGCDYTYIGDNFLKDFETPNRFGWTTIALKDSGRNIHSQAITVNEAQKPKIIVKSLSEIPALL